MLNIGMVDKLINEGVFYHLYQPLYFLSDWRLKGYEAFLRTEMCNTPAHIFQEAMKTKKLYELDTVSIFKAVELFTSRNQTPGLKLFINVFPSTLLHPSFQQFLDKLLSIIRVKNTNLVFEINELQEIADINAMRKVIYLLHQHSIHVAIDDVGKGEASLKNVIELEADFIKLDKYFAKNLSRSEKKQKLIQLMVNYCGYNTRLILEGIEEPEDLAIAKALGVHIGQGYLLGQPKLLKD